MNHPRPEGSPSPRAMLIFPPVWVPMVPHLALPVLTAYLRGQGFTVAPLDANVDFFTGHLLTPATLSDLRAALEKRLGKTGASAVPASWRELARTDLARWEEDIPRVQDILAVFRDPDRFFAPDVVLEAQERMGGLLNLASLAQWPGRISFNRYQRGDVWTEQDLLSLCQDPERNVFLPYWEQRVMPRIRETSPALVGISISSVHQFVAAATLGHLLRRHLPDVHVVVGGKHILRIQRKLEAYPIYLEHLFHSAVLHEGELPLTQLMDAVSGARRMHKVSGLAYRRAGRTIVNPLAEPPPLTELPSPDFTDMPWDEYLVPRRYAPVRMSRGCYWGKCTFCIRYGDERVDYLPTKNVVDEIQRLQDLHAVRDITVNDDCMPPSYWEELCDGISRRGLESSMLIWAKPVAGFTKKRLGKMARAGVRQIRWGVESGHPRILKLMRKGTTLPATLRVLQDAHEAGIWNHACIILGFPTETREEAQTTLDFIDTHRNMIQSVILYPFILYENSYLFHHPEEFAVRDVRVNDTPFFDTISYATDQGMGPEETRTLVRKGKERILEQTYQWPFWYYLKLREYLQLYLDRYGLERTLALPFHREGLRKTWEGLGP